MKLIPIISNGSFQPLGGKYVGWLLPLESTQILLSPEGIQARSHFHLAAGTPFCAPRSQGHADAILVFLVEISCDHRYSEDRSLPFFPLSFQSPDNLLRSDWVGLSLAIFFFILQGWNLPNPAYLWLLTLILCGVAVVDKIFAVHHSMCRPIFPWQSSSINTPPSLLYLPFSLIPNIFFSLYHITSKPLQAHGLATVARFLPTSSFSSWRQEVSFFHNAAHNRLRRRFRETEAVMLEHHLKAGRTSAKNDEGISAQTTEGIPLHQKTPLEATHNQRTASIC